MYIFLYHSREGQAKGSLFFLEDALRRYAEHTGAAGAIPGLTKNEKGKPVVLGGKVFVSASHSGDWVACAVSESEVGIDIQEKRRTDSARILKRFGTAEEAGLVKTGGEEKFFEIWCIKEAFSKYVGEGLSYGLGKIQTCTKIEEDGPEAFVISDKVNGIKIRSGRLPFDENVYFALAGEGTVEWVVSEKPE